MQLATAWGFQLQVFDIKHYKTRSFRQFRTYLRKFPRSLPLPDELSHLFFCQWLLTCTSTWLQLVGEFTWASSTQLGDLSNVFCVVGVMPSTFHLTHQRQRLPKIGEFSYNALKLGNRQQRGHSTIFEESAPSHALSDPHDRNHKSLAIGNHNLEVASFARRNCRKIALSQSQKSHWAKDIAAIRNHTLVVATISGGFPDLCAASETL